ncbi:hypothetical protein K466DRAFT_588382 [Polyporus arcularius HHB13444]|uniref:DUF6533 domain-containing protein n=1 Tax=Polyporus arcularius HHB13444 TaxID=1314778 RepID=A0A5C3P5Z6_9APHY|nr:hypothetical protein K466DRAFT_588382 [Polyporus arcularius HHB13444]
MSSRYGTGAAAIVETYEGFVIDNCLGLAALAFLVYEYMVTFEREVNLFWNSKMTGAVALFLLNRYIVLVTSLLAVSGIVVEFPASSCGPMAKVTNAFAMLQYLPWAAFSAIRVYALSSSSACMLLIFILSVAPAGAALVHLALGLTGEIDPVFGCIVFDPTTPDIAHKYSVLMLCLALVTIGSRTCLILADALIILITWRTIPRRRWTHSHSSSFGSILVWNGTSLIFSLSLCRVLTNFVQVSAPFQAASYVILFIHPITGILVSRFLFDLQGANRQALHLDSKNGPMSYSTYISDGSLSFARVIGSIGSSIPSTSMYSDDPDFDFASQTSTAEATSSPTLSVVIHITRETTTELGSPDMSTLGSHSVPPAYDDEDAGILSLHARKVTFDDGAVV